MTYNYDTLGRRISRTAQGITTRFLYDGDDVVRDIVSDGRTVDYLNGPGIDNKLRQYDAATGPLYFLQNNLGSTIALTDGVGSVVEMRQYEAYGAGPGSAFTRYGYTGRELDPATGLMYYRARYYDPGVGRFVSEDPIRFASGTVDFYAYTQNNPIIRVDPLGLYDGWNLLRDFGTFSEAAVDAGTFGSASRLNDALGADAFVDRCSFVHNAGTVAGLLLVTAITAGVGAEAAAAEEGAEITGETATQLARRLGAEGEEIAGISGPKSAIRLPDGTLRFPDEITNTALTEVKNTAYQPFTQQLRDYANFAQQNGLNFNLITRISTRLSGPLQQAVDSGLINLLKILP